MARALAAEHGWHSDVLAALTAEHEGWVLLDGEKLVGGACVTTERPGATPKFAWAWVDPDYRRQGHLTALWALMTARHGVLDVEPIQTEAMQAFLAKMENSR